MRKILLFAFFFVLCFFSHAALSDPEFNTGSGWTVDGTASVTFNGRLVITKDMFDTVTQVWQLESAFDPGETWKATFNVDTVMMPGFTIGWQNASYSWKSGGSQAVTTPGVYSLTCNDSNYSWVVIETSGSIMSGSLESCYTEQLSGIDSWELY